MASKIKAPPQKEELLEKGAPETPLLDLLDAGVKKFMRSAKKRGFVTHEQINALLAAEEIKSDQIEDILAKFSEMGINVVDTLEAAEPDDEPGTREEPEEDEEDESETELVEVRQQPVAAKSAAKVPAERSADPVRMYLREMGSLELLSREGEIAIAKRIEAGREAMIAGLCESPLTFQAIIIWRDELNEGKAALRDIIDLEATYAGPDAKAMPEPATGPDGQLIASGAVSTNQDYRRRSKRRPLCPRPPLPFKPAGDPPRARDGRGRDISENDLDEEDMENWLSVTAIEAELKPKVIETFDTVAGAYKRLRRLQEQDIQFQLKSQSLSPAQERKYKKLKNEIIGEVKSLRLNQARIDALVEQLYDINKRLVGYEGRLMRLAESHGVRARRLPQELSGLGTRPALAQPRVEALGQRLEELRRAKTRTQIKSHRHDIHALASRDRA